eukprot:11184745-Lingulodinium_polyedra.AAC.1
MVSQNGNQSGKHSPQERSSPGVGGVCWCPVCASPSVPAGVALVRSARVLCACVSVCLPLCHCAPASAR